MPLINICLIIYSLGKSLLLPSVGRTHTHVVTASATQIREHTMYVCRIYYIHSLPICAVFFTFLHAFEPCACLFVLDKHRNEGAHARNDEHTRYVNPYYIHSLPIPAPFFMFLHPFEPRACLFVLDDHRNEGTHVRNDEHTRYSKCH